MDSVNSLSELLSQQKSTSFVEIPGEIADTFGQKTISATLPMSKLFFTMYEVDLEVQRAIIPRNLSKLMDYIMLYLEHKQPVFFQGSSCPPEAPACMTWTREPSAFSRSRNCTLWTDSTVWPLFSA